MGRSLNDCFIFVSMDECIQSEIWELELFSHDSVIPTHIDSALFGAGQADYKPFRCNHTLGGSDPDFGLYRGSYYDNG
ncbi:hypothetical protein D3C78_1569350 [compost metagenome]